MNAASLSPQENEIIDWLAVQGDAMQVLLARLVNIDSGSYNKRGVDRVGAAIRDFLTEHAIAHDIIPNDSFGDALRARVGGGPEAPVLLLGHRDTVFPEGEAERRPFRVEAGRAYGPGVADMKAGLTLACFVAAAFKRFGGAPVPLVLLFTADEEIASPSSRPIIAAEAKRARAVLNVEPSRSPDMVTTGRKAAVFMRLEVAGKAAHAANPANGINAIAELAHKIVALHGLTDLDKGITVNVGTISGGQTINTVAPSAGAEVELRYVNPEDRSPAMAAIERIVASPTVPGATATLEIFGEFLPLVQTPASERLFDLYAECSASFGVTVTGSFGAGCSDAGVAAAAGAPTLCSVGPIGSGAHSPAESLDLSSLVPRAQILALTIARIARLDAAG